MHVSFIQQFMVNIWSTFGPWAHDIWLINLLCDKNLKRVVTIRLLSIISLTWLMLSIAFKLISKCSCFHVFASVFQFFVDLEMQFEPRIELGWPYKYILLNILWEGHKLRAPIFIACMRLYMKLVPFLQFSFVQFPYLYLIKLNNQNNCDRGIFKFILQIKVCMIHFC